MHVTSVTLGFELHQPFRVREDFFWNRRMFTPMGKGFDGLFEGYFSGRNKEIFEKVAKKCYYPSNNIILECIDSFRRERRKFKVSFSLSGIFLEQCERFEPDLLDTFVQLKETGCVEFLDQTYHHGLASLYETPEIFIEDVKRHNSAIKELLGLDPDIFENTEFIYNNRIAGLVEELGYRCIFTEGLDRITGGGSPNHVYRARDREIRVLLRNYQLTDDVGFRFSSRDWEEYPITADKYSSWLASTHGDCINIFMDYETFGEHQWAETGIFEFLRFLPGEVLKWEHLEFATPGEVIDKYTPVGEVDAYELGGTVSWADLERDTSCWLGNSMQWAAFTYHKHLHKKMVDTDLRRIWGYLSTSDHLYYMFTSGGGPGEVHSYFSPFENPSNSFLSYMAVLFDLDSRISSGLELASDPFIFSNHRGEMIDMAFGKKDFAAALERINSDSLRFHMVGGDFQKWTRNCLKDLKLAEKIDGLDLEKLDDKSLKKKLANLFVRTS